MEDNLFDDKSVVPDGRSVLKALGDMATVWLDLRKYIQENYGPAIEEWKYYGPTSGWTMKFISKKRNLFFFTAIRGGFNVFFMFDDKAVDAIERSDLPKNIIDEVKNGTRYPEGRELRLEVKDKRTAVTVRSLIKIKAEN